MDKTCPFPINACLSIIFWILWKTHDWCEFFSEKGILVFNSLAYFERPEASKKKGWEQVFGLQSFFFFGGRETFFFFFTINAKLQFWIISNIGLYWLAAQGFYVIIPSIISSKDAVNHACFTLFHQLTTFYSLFSLSLPLSLTHTHTHKLLQPKYRLFNFVVKLLYYYSFCKNKTIGTTIS